MKMVGNSGCPNIARATSQFQSRTDTGQFEISPNSSIGTVGLLFQDSHRFRIIGNPSIPLCDIRRIVDRSDGKRQRGRGGAPPVADRQGRRIGVII